MSRDATARLGIVDHSSICRMLPPGHSALRLKIQPEEFINLFNDSVDLRRGKFVEAGQP